MQDRLLSYERELWKQGYKVVVGLDEAGRGPLAGPVVAGAVFISQYPKFRAQGDFDSKKLTPQMRDELYEILTNHPEIQWGIGKVSEHVIDTINIFEATKLAMNRAVASLGRKLQKKNLKPDFLILDGNFLLDLALAQKAVIKADTKIFSCMASSIIAKVTRDRIMRKYHREYPEYGFDRHKGYGTKLHVAMLERYGPCEIHRKSFQPVSSMGIVSGM